jgi:anti-anti-sigma factor
MDREDSRKSGSGGEFDPSLDRSKQSAPRAPDADSRAIRNLVDEVCLAVDSSHVWLRAMADLTYRNYPVLRAALDHYRQLGVGHIHLDLSDASYIDSATVALFARVQMELLRSKGSLYLLNPTQTVANILKTVRLGELIPVVQEYLPARVPRAPEPTPDATEPKKR